MLQKRASAPSAENRVTAIDGGNTETDTYNALGEKVQFGNSAGGGALPYGAEGQNVGFFTFSDSSWTDSYVYLGSRQIAWLAQANEYFTHFIHANVTDSTTQVTDQAGNLGTAISGNSEDLVWYPFGVEYTNSGSWNDTVFGGMEPYQRNFGLNPTPNRLQSPLLGRWMSPDPVGGDVTNPQSLNRYAYVLNNPTTLTDPLGLNPADNCSYASYYYSHANCGGPPPDSGCEEWDNGSCTGDPTCDNSFGLNGPNNCGNSPADVLGFPIGGSTGYGGIGSGGSAPGAPPAGQPPLRGGASFLSPNDAAVWEQIEQQYPWIVSTVWACAYAPVCQEVVAGAAVGVAVGYGVAKLENYIHQVRGQSDPVSGVKPVNPGRDASGNCNPCPEPPPAWEVPGSLHGSTSGTHWHWIEWNQDPLTCTCYPKRKSGPSAP